MATQRTIRPVRTDAGAGDELARAFAWLARSGVGVRLGDRPIGWYQAHQCRALGLLAEKMGGHGALRFSADGIIFGKRDGVDRWAVLGTADELFQEADRRARQ